MSKNEDFTVPQLFLINEMVDCRLCVSKAEARRMVMMMPEEKIKERLEKIKIKSVSKVMQRHKLELCLGQHPWP